MAYLGNTPTNQSFTSGTDYFNGTGSQTAFTLSRTVASQNDVQVVVNNVVQQPNDAYTISGTTLTMTSAPSAGTNNVYVRYLSTTTQAITPSQNTVSWSTLDSNVQGDLGISFKNRIINGACTIAQRGTSFTGLTSGGNAFPVDRFRVSNSDTVSVVSASQVTDAPAGFVNSIRTQVTTINATPNNETFIEQIIEGFNTNGFAYGTSSAVSLTLSFWVKASVAGIYNVWFLNAAATKNVASSFTINSANTWEYKTIIISGDSVSALATDNTASFYVRWYLNAQNALVGTLDSTWTAGGGNRLATGSVRFTSTLNATYQITGVQLEVGTQATTFTTAGGSYGAELALCQRYFVNVLNASVDIQQIITRDSTTQNWINLATPVSMRSTPTLGVPSGFGRIIAYDTSFNIGFPTISSMSIGAVGGANQYHILISASSSSGSNVYTSYDTLGASTPLSLSAEL